MSRLLLMAFVSALLAACGSGGGGGGGSGGAGGSGGGGGTGGGEAGSGGGGPAVVASIEITPEVGSVSAGSKLQLIASAFGPDGERVNVDTFGWASSDPSVATVDSTGLVTGRKAGEVAIDATIAGQRGTAQVTVTPAPKYEVRISPDDAEVPVGFVQKFSAALFDEDGGKVDDHEDPIWSVDDEEIATIGADGTLKGLRPGAVEVRAAIDGNEGTLRIPVVLRFAQVVVGNGFACARTLGGEAWCWGDGQDGQLGAGAGLRHAERPVKVSGDVTFSSLASGDFHTCGTTSSGQVWCWGINVKGQLGVDAFYSPVPVQVPFLPSGAFVGSVSLGGASSCALTADAEISGGIIWCWGAIEGAAKATEHDFGTRFRSIDVGNDHVCAIGKSAASSTLWCWGGNDHGQSDPSLAGEDVLVPFNLGDLKGTVYAVGANHTCARFESDGKTRCWGNGQLGQLGDGSVSPASAMVEVRGNHAFTSLSASATQTCGIDADGAWCWGKNVHGALGVGFESEEPVTEPTQVVGSFVSVSPGDGSSCGVGTDSLIYCWGSNSSHQLGAGLDGALSVEPVLVWGQLAE